MIIESPLFLPAAALFFAAMSHAPSGRCPDDRCGPIRRHRRQIARMASKARVWRRVPPFRFSAHGSAPIGRRVMTEDHATLALRATLADELGSPLSAALAYADLL